MGSQGEEDAEEDERAIADVNFELAQTEQETDGKDETGEHSDGGHGAQPSRVPAEGAVIFGDKAREN